MFKSNIAECQSISVHSLTTDVWAMKFMYTDPIRIGEFKSSQWISELYYVSAKNKEEAYKKLVIVFQSKHPSATSFSAECVPKNIALHVVEKDE